MANRLTLVPGRDPEFHAYFWEPLIDGRPLRQQIIFDTDDQALDGGERGPTGDTIPVFVHSWPVGPPDEVLMLLGRLPSALPDQRIPLFVCPVCGDLGCGAVSAAVDHTAGTVTWRDFGWDVNYPPDDDEPPIRYAGGPFVFDRTEYEAELQRFLDTFDQVRASVPPRPEPRLGGRASGGVLRYLFRRSKA